MRSLRLLSLALATLLVGLTASPAEALSIFGPAYPAPGGNTFSGVGNVNDPGGFTASYGSFSLPASVASLYWGPWSGLSPASPYASLDGTPHSLTLSGISGTTATWSGTTSWTDPDTSTYYASIPIQVDVTISGLGGNPFPWVLATSVAGLDPGPGAGIGAVVDNSAGLDYSANILFSADTGSGYVALNTIHQGSGGMTLGSFTGGFYYTPEPASGLLLGGGLLGIALRRRRS